MYTVRTMSLALPWANSRISLDEIHRRIKIDGALKPYFNAMDSVRFRKGQKYGIVANDMQDSGRVYGAAIMMYQGQKFDLVPPFEQ